MFYVKNFELLAKSLLKFLLCLVYLLCIIPLIFMPHDFSCHCILFIICLIFIS